jgi:uncharacterized membrane protein
MKRFAVIGILALSFCGLANSVYLAQHEISGTPLLCNIQNLTGCNIVANSPYSLIFGVPIAEYGVLFFAILFVLAGLELVLSDRLLRRVLQGISLLCVLASLYFISLQVFFINAFCIYCIASAIITFLILVCATLIEPFIKVSTPPVPQSAFPSPQENKLPMPPAA